MKLEATKIGSSYGGAVVDEYTVKDGIELLDHYAGHALNGLITTLSNSVISSSDTHERLVNSSFKIAKRMLAARGEYL